MKFPIVVDCSYVAAFFLREDAGDRFEKTLSLFMEGACTLWVPELFYTEMQNVFLMAWRRKRIPRRDLHACCSDLHSLPLQVPHLDRKQHGMQILHVAEKWDLTFYDATYLALTMQLNATLKTFDRDLLKLQSEFDWIQSH